MSTETKSVKSKRFKGSVLFTTLVVMILILLIMLSAIGLAGMASKRAYSTWYDNQTKYTAQDLVDNVIELLGPKSTDDDMKALGQSIVDSLGTKKSSVSLDVTANGSKTIPGYGTVNSLTFTYVADNRSDFTMSVQDGNKHENEKIIKVSASVTMGGETSTYSTYVVGNKLGKSTDSNGGGFIATGSLKSGDYSQDGPGTIGRMYAGIEVPDASKYRGGAANDSIFGGDVFLNMKTFEMKESGTKIFLGRNDPESGYYSGMRVTGDVHIDHALVVDVISNYPPAYLTDTTAEKFYNAPYLYIDGKLDGGKGLKVSGLDPDAGKKGMLNLYCNQLDLNSNAELSGNINLMIMGENLDNKINVSGSNLTDWASQVLGGSGTSNLKTGSLYCKGNFTKEGNGLTINGDLCVLGDLTIASGDIDVKGKVFVGGTINDDTKIKTATVKESGLGKSLDTFKNQLNTKDSAVAANFNTAFTTEESGKSYIQTLDNIKRMIRTSEGKFVGVEETSGYSGPDNYDGTSDTITSSCNWTAASHLEEEVSKTIYINPPDGEDLWINIKSDLGGINYKTIIVDDSGTGKVKFFVEKSGTGRNLNFKGTKIMTKTYYDYMFGSKKNDKLVFSSYPGGNLVPHIFMFSPSDSVVNIYGTNEFMYTGDIVMPKGKFRAEAVNTEKEMEYTYYMYKSGSTEKLNPIVVSGKRKIAYIGSLEVEDIDVDNKYGYFYVDDPPVADEDPGDTDDYTWTAVEGYSTY
ncbi:hypothetical protein [Ruminococcus sp. HUN007]|uniref:hypothetical protein n=1 Tax=Ruminococcus sp. HUN007 TaxID=1514668 RepID=UPI0005D1CEF5|nr:hypothetical protein [Ruminococcus sp. HUN007]